MKGSRHSQSGGSKSPVQLRATWKGGDDQGFFVIYDVGKKEQIEVKDELWFLPMEEGVKITGWNKQLKKGIYSNFVLSTKTDVLKVKWDDGKELATGLWVEIRDQVKLMKGKYTATVFAMYTGDDARFRGKLIEVQFAGGACAPWYDIKSESNCYSENVEIRWNGVADEKTNDGVTYLVPQLEWREYANSQALNHAEKLLDQVGAYIEGGVAEEKPTNVFDSDGSVEKYCADLANIDVEDDLLRKWPVRAGEIAALDDGVKEKILNIWQIKLDQIGEKGVTLKLDPAIQYLDEPKKNFPDVKTGPGIGATEADDDLPF